jgi:hypothetical protein
MSEKDEGLQIVEEKNDVPNEKELISMYGLRKFEFYLLTFVLYLVTMGCLLWLLPEETSISRTKPFELDYFILILMLGLYSFFSFKGKASEVDLAKITGLYFYTLYNVYFALPKLQRSLAYLDLSNTGDFLRLASSILIVLGMYPIIYSLGKLAFKKDITIEEWKKRNQEKDKKEES